LGDSVFGRCCQNAALVALAEQAEADAAAAEAVAAAARARARAIRLRRAAESNRANVVGSDATDWGGIATIEKTEAVDLTDVDSINTDTAEASVPARARRRWISVPRLRHLLAALAALVICGTSAATGYMTWHDHKANLQRQRTAEFSAAASNGVRTLLSIDFKRAKEDVQHIIDNSTGPFKADFQASADGMVKVAQDAKVMTTTSVSAAAVQSMTNDSAVVLVAATSEVTNSVGAKKEPRTWRLKVTVARDGGRIKLSTVEFVP
jgi:Mce-associated membrane protein